MNIVDQLSGGATSSDITTSINNLDVDLREDDLIKTLKGSFSDKSTKKDIAPKTYKAMWKQVNNSLTKIYNTITNNSKPNNSELYEKVSHLSKEVISNKVIVTELKESLVKDPQTKLREEDDNKDEAQKVISESVTEVIEKSETIASIEDKLVDLETKVGVNAEKSNQSSGLLSGILDVVSNIPGPIGKVAKLISTVINLVSSFPQAFLLTGFIKEGITKAMDMFKPLKESVESLKGMLPNSIKDFFSSSEKNIVKETVEKGAKTVLKETAPDLTKTALKETAEEIAEKGLKESIEIAAEKGITKVAEKSLFKTLLKKIPILGALAGAGFAIPRLIDGDYKGAALEVSSGIASSFPGAGTAASVGIDAALFARDLNQSTDVSTVDLDVNPDKTKKVIDSVKPVSIFNDNTTINNSNSNVRNVSMEENEADFIRASKF